MTALTLSRSAYCELAAIILNSEQKCIIAKLLTLTSQSKRILLRTGCNYSKLRAEVHYCEVAHFTFKFLIFWPSLNRIGRCTIQKQAGRDALNMSSFQIVKRVIFPFPSLSFGFSLSFRRFFSGYAAGNKAESLT